MNVELKRLLHLLDDMYSSSKIAVNFDIVLLICDVVTLIRYQIAKTISLEVDASQSFIVHLPENALRQVLFNLLLNAAQALEEQSCGHICVKVYKADLGLMIEVLDDGRGFSQTLLDNEIRLPSHRQRESDSGLVMVQQFIKTLGGTVKLSNRLAHGACVSLFLPDKYLVET